MEGHRGLRRGGSIPCLHPERHQLSGDRRDRGAPLRCAEGEMGGPPRTHLPAAHRQHRLQGRQRFRLLHALGRRLRTRRHTRRRLHSRPRTRSCAWCASCRSSRSLEFCKVSSSACHRPARSRASSSSACGSACAPTRSAARGGRATAVRTGATTRCMRLAPFIAHCHIPPRPDGTHILCHDQIEAVLMRRAGFEVRVLPEEGASWEENPPTLLEFIRRDLRWAQGNMQYWPYLVMPGLRPVSRYQIAFAMLMFLGSPAWIGLLVLGTHRGRHARRGELHPAGCRHGAVHHHADHVVRAEDRHGDRRGLAACPAALVRRRGAIHRSARSPKRSSS